MSIEDELIELVSKVEDIQHQLADYNAGTTNRDEDWARRARYALRATMKEYRKKKSQMRARRLLVLGLKPDPSANTAEALLRSAYPILRRCRTEGQLEPDELEVFVAIERKLIEEV